MNTGIRLLVRMIGLVTLTAALLLAGPLPVSYSSAPQLQPCPGGDCSEQAGQPERDVAAQVVSALIRTDPAGLSLSLGQTAGVSIRLDNVAGLAGAEFHITYNPAIMEVQDANAGQTGIQIAPGSLLRPDFVAQNNVDATYGRIDFGVLQLPPNAPVSGSGVLATFTLRGKAPGSSPLTFNLVNLSDGNSMPIAVSVQHGQVSVGGGIVIPTQPAPIVTPTPLPAPMPMPSSAILGYHTVLPGETLFCIGRAYGVSPWAIAGQNGLTPPYEVWAGQRLAIPSVPWTNMTAGPVCQRQFDIWAPPPVPVPPTPTPWSGTGTWYQVQYYDTLESIAARFNTTVYAIMQANNLSSQYVYPGQWLFIPYTYPYPTPYPYPYPTPLPPPGPYPGEAWLGHYFDNMVLGGSPAVQRLDPAIDFAWGASSPFPGQVSKDFFSVRWTRSVYFQGGMYRFYAWVDDGVRIYVDNRLVVNEWRDSNAVVYFDDATVTSGLHEVKVEYYEHGHDALISVWWERLY